MTRRATLDVQLIAHTIFTPPIDRETGELVFEPEPGNLLFDNGLDVPCYDGQALAEFAGRACYQSFDRPRPETATNDGYLRNTIGKQKHWSIAEHGSVTFYITGVSRSLTHELIRHRHLSYSELSQRYVDASDARFVVPPLFEELVRKAAAEAPRDEEGRIFTPVGRVTEAEAVRQAIDELVRRNYEETLDEYVDSEVLLEEEFPDNKKKENRQAARAVLPNATETKIVVTGNYRAWAGFLLQRDSPAADAEIRRLAQAIGSHLAAVAPNIFGPETRALWDDSVEHGVSSR